MSKTLFCGNSITQGGSASRSGNIFCNIVSRKLDNEIYNMSVSQCCKGALSVAKNIGIYNARAIVVDFTRNADSFQSFSEQYQSFYDELRKYHNKTRIILMDTSNFNNDIIHNDYNSVVYRTYKNAIDAGHNTLLIKQKELFTDDESDLITIDGIHYTDYGMYRVADAICDAILGDEKAE